MKLIYKLLLACVLMVPGFSFADLVGTWNVSSGQTITVHYKDDNHIRMDIDQGAYMLILGNKAYSVTNQGGQRMVIDLDSMGGMMQAYGSMINQQVEDNFEKFDPAAIKISKKSKRETVAGYKGTVYEVTIPGPKGAKTEEFVASNNPRVIKFQHAFIAMSEKMMKLMASDQSLDHFNHAVELVVKKEMGGLLRYGKDVKLGSLKEVNVDPATYRLPKNTMMMSIPGFMR